MTISADLSLMLPLELPPLPGPFTPADAARLGVGRSSLERMVREGRVVRLVRGVYLDAARPCTPPVRAQALARVVGPDRVVCGLTAAWLHGAAHGTLTWAGDAQVGVVPLELRGQRQRRLGSDQVVRVGYLLATSPVRTAVDLARRLEGDRAVAVLDALLSCGAVSRPGLLDGARGAGGPGSVNVRAAAARSDERSTGPSETVLRLRWSEARLPTPVPGLRYGGIRLGLALPEHRFAVVLAGSLAPPQQLALESRRWRIVTMRSDQVLGSSERTLRGHLEREFHQHLLEQVG